MTLSHSKNFTAGRTFFSTILLFIITFTVVYGQEQHSDSLKENHQLNDAAPETQYSNMIETGIMYHLQLDYIDFSPYIEYRVHEKFAVGAGLSSMYYLEDIDRNKVAWGGFVYGRYYVIEKLFFHAELLSGVFPYLNKLDYKRKYVNTFGLYLGAGYRQPITERINSFLTVTYDLNHNQVSLHRNTLLIKAGIGLIFQ